MHEKIGLQDFNPNSQLEHEFTRLHCGPLAIHFLNLIYLVCMQSLVDVTAIEVDVGNDVGGRGQVNGNA